jgi:hypothetical protein
MPWVTTAWLSEAPGDDRRWALFAPSDDQPTEII